jgi:hypothetical protein
MHQDVQDEIYEHIISVVGHGRDPVIDDYPKLTKVLSVFYEALRMFPSAFLLMREAAEDTVLQIPGLNGQEGTTPLVVKKGVNVIVDLIGIRKSLSWFYPFVFNAYRHRQKTTRTTFRSQSNISLGVGTICPLIQNPSLDLVSGHGNALEESLPRRRLLRSFRYSYTNGTSNLY